MEIEEAKAIVKNMTKMFAFGGLKTDTTEAIETLLSAVTVTDEMVNVVQETYANKTGIRCNSLALRAAFTAALGE